MSYLPIDRSSTAHSLTGRRCCCWCGVCRNCWGKICAFCCPRLFEKEPYAGVEYLPIEGPPLTHQSLLAARKSISASTHHFPHISEQVSDHSNEEDMDEYDYSHSAVTEEPHSRRRLFESKVHSTSDGKLKFGEELSDSASSNSDHDLGVELGFVDYEDDDRLIGQDVRIRRTPELKDVSSFDSSSDDYQLAIRSQSIGSNDQPVVRSRVRSFHVDPITDPQKPSLQLSMYFDEKHNLLVVHILKAFNLPTKRPKSTSNPFAEAYLLPNKAQVFETRVLRETLSPVFDQAFKFCNVSIDDIKKKILVVRIYLHGKHHFLGGVLFSLENANLFGTSHTMELTLYDEEEGLKDSCKGDLLLSMTYHPEAGTLDILVLEASNLKKQDFIGLPNPYMKVNTIQGGNRISKWKTGAQKSTLNAVFNELCVLDIGSMNIDELQVEVLVMDFDRFGRNSELGSVSFGCDVRKESGKVYWNQVINNPNISHLCWHVITNSESTSRLLRSPIRSKKSPVSCVGSSGQ